MTDFAATKEDLAFHEAGHCWGFWSIKRAFRYTTLKPRTEGFNALTVGYRAWEFDEADLAAWVAHAGPVAEFAHRVNRSPNDPNANEHLQAVNEGAQGDMQVLDRWMHNPEAEARLRAVGLHLPKWKPSDTLIPDLLAAIDAHWEGISQTAEILVGDGRITGSQAFEIFNATAPAKSE